MSDLQIVLIILGAFIIAGVLVYNWLQERKLYQQVNNDFIVPQKDVLAEDFYIDTDMYVEKELAELPTKIKQHMFDAHADAGAEKIVRNNTAIEDNVSIEVSAHALHSEIAEPAFTQPVQAAHSVEADIADIDTNQAFQPVRADSKPSEEANNTSELDNTPPQLPLEVHPQIDLTAILFTNKQFTYQALCDMVASIGETGLPTMVYGLDNHDKWHLIELNHTTDTDALTFKQATCSLQLADRGGPVTKNVLNKFQFAVESAGLELGAHVEWQGSGDVLQRAVEIDQFCIEVDQLINVHVAQNEAPIHGTKFRGLVEASGMVLNHDGKFYYFNNDLTTSKSPLFCVIDGNNQAFTAESLRNSVLKVVTFQLEIPKVPNCEQAFNQMMLIAQKLSTSLNAHLVDDNQKPLGDLQIEKIRQQLKVIHATMVARGVMPGSSASMRLFN